MNTVLQADHAAPCHEHNADTLKTKFWCTMAGMTFTNVIMLSCNITFLCPKGYQYALGTGSTSMSIRLLEV